MAEGQAAGAGHQGQARVRARAGAVAQEPAEPRQLRLPAAWPVAVRCSRPPPRPQLSLPSSHLIVGSPSGMDLQGSHGELIITVAKVLTGSSGRGRQRNNYLTSTFYERIGRELHNIGQKRIKKMTSRQNRTTHPKKELFSETKG